MARQGRLWSEGDGRDILPPHPLRSLPPSHRGDPTSSHEAAHGVRLSAKSQSMLVYRLLCQFPGQSGIELATRCQLDKYQVRRRLTDLKDAGWIYPQGTVRVDGRKHVRWWPSRT